ncbi:Oxysterol-binding protein-domain-containing protein [Bisporella sp. PMI_857]|nr:Oxysterol-binding protein-domain-containing protein [Bisporella sp. PMI_857]
MAGLEQLEIHSKSYIVRWVKVEEGHTISWSVQPHKKSINFGIFKHPGHAGTGAGAASAAVSSSEDLLQVDGKSRRQSSAGGGKNDSSTAQEQLKAKGFLPVQWYGKCEADKVSIGTYAVQPGHGGMYGLVFDNTFSIAFGKTATFVLLTYPTNAPPHTTHHLQNLPGVTAGAGLNSIGKSQSPHLGASASESVDSLQSHLVVGNSASRGNSVVGRTDSETALPTFHAGVLQKRRRKRGQGYARRFFSLDFASCTLSYYHDRNTSALRGAIPLSLAAITADEKRREISIDSGAEVWHLKASNAKDFGEWTIALQRASNTARGVDVEKTPSPEKLNIKTTGLQSTTSSQDDFEWEQVESLVSRIVGTRDALRRLSKDTAPGSKGQPYSGLGLGLASGSLTSPGPTLEDNSDYFATVAEKKSFWKRKSSAPSTPNLFARSIQSQLAIPTPGTITTVTANNTASPAPRKSKHEEISMHDHCSALLKDLDATLADFSVLIANSKRRRMPPPKSAADRNSIDSTTSDQFFDAEADIDRSQVVLIDRQSEEDTQPSEAEADDDEYATDSSSIPSDEEDNVDLTNSGTITLFPVKAKSLEPLPLSITPQRRKAVPPATVMPPSLIAFFRKNVGKDLSTISMPVSANEPSSLLQRTAEQLEYANLLDTAAAHKSPTYRLLYVATFAVSQFSSGRAKERAIRKPFNPMLGETYELIRSEKEYPGGFRLLVEKVSHRPVVMAIQADSTNWSFSQSPAPTQKFWGKSAELITDGRVRTALRLPDGTDEHYSWNVATVFLRNVVVGEKYVEPVGTMTITNETTGAKTTVEFIQEGLFGGRSEKLKTKSTGSDGQPTGVELTGTWTNSIRVVEKHGKEKEIWHCGNLVENATQRYGFTTFAASLNEITEIEKDKLPPTDTRLRPDQRAAENGDLDQAEKWKAMLEDGQRKRRKELEEKGEAHKVRWFVKVDASDHEEVWKLKTGKEGYWEERAKGKWEGIENILAG